MEGVGLFRRVAKRCRELATRTDIEVVKEQLQIWAEEFDEQAGQVESAERLQTPLIPRG